MPQYHAQSWRLSVAAGRSFPHMRQAAPAPTPFVLQTTPVPFGTKILAIRSGTVDRRKAQITNSGSIRTAEDALRPVVFRAIAFREVRRLAVRKGDIRTAVEHDDFGVFIDPSQPTPRKMPRRPLRQRLGPFSLSPITPSNHQAGSRGPRSRWGYCLGVSGGVGVVEVGGRPCIMPGPTMPEPIMPGPIMPEPL